MLSNKEFWVGFLLAYGLAVVLPPKRLLAMGKGRQG